jgi:hypothetical protein
MTEAQEIVASLCAPFAEHEVRILTKGGMRLAYITARTAMNRLDEVVGPDNWFDEYDTFGDQGVKCRLFVRFTPGEGFVSKCGIGGHAGMADADDDEKSAESSAFKRAAVKFGVGRYLYQDGVPAFCGDCPAPNGASRPEAARAPGRQQARQAPPSRQAPQQPRYSERPGFDNFARLPTAGRGVYAWAKNMEDHYKTSLVDGMAKAGVALAIGGNLTNWNQKQVNEIAGRAVGYIRSLTNYDGKLDDVDVPEEVGGNDDDNPF